LGIIEKTSYKMMCEMLRNYHRTPHHVSARYYKYRARWDSCGRFDRNETAGSSVSVSLQGDLD